MSSQDVDLDPLAAISAAVEKAGLDDFGDVRFTEGLARYFASLEGEGKLSAAGRMGVLQDTEQLLVNRLRFQADVKAHPEILDEPIYRPLFILGLLRTGTTKLQQMIARDRGVLSLPYWRVNNLAPLPGTRTDRTDLRIAAAGAVLGALSEMAPELLAAHPMQVMEPEEEAFIMRLTFESLANGMFDRVPSYLSWLVEQPQTYTYEYLRSMLQYVQWQEGGSQMRPWVLKTPMHLAHLDALVEVFPDATVVHAHRDPVVAIASTLRTCEITWRSRGGDVAPSDLSFLAQFWAGQMQTNMKQRDALGDRLNIVDVQYTDIVDGPMGVVRRIYDVWSRDLGTAAEVGMSEWIAENPQNRFGKHSYTLENYGLDRDSVHGMFHRYLERFDTAQP